MALSQKPGRAEPAADVPASLGPPAKPALAGAAPQHASSHWLAARQAATWKRSRDQSDSPPANAAASAAITKRAKTMAVQPHAASPKPGPSFFEGQGLGTVTCLQHAFNNAWQTHAWDIDAADVSYGADISLVCRDGRFAHRQMMRLEVDKEQLRAIEPLLLGELERMVVYRGLYTMEEEVQGHYTALLKQNGDWYELDSLKPEPGPRKVDASAYLAESLTEGSTLLAAVPSESSPRIRIAINALAHGAFSYACRLLGHLYGTQPIEALSNRLAEQHPNDPVLTPARLTAYLQSQGRSVSHELLPPVGRDGNDLQTMLNYQLAGHAQGLLWVRTAPFVIAVRKRGETWEALMQDLDHDGAPFVSRPPAAIWSALQEKFDEQHSAASDQRKPDIEAQRGAVDFIGLAEALPDTWPVATRAVSMEEGASRSQTENSRIGEIRKVLGRTSYFAVMEFNPKGELQIAAHPFSYSNTREVEQLAEKTRKEIREGRFDEVEHRNKLWGFHNRPVSAAPGVSWDDRNHRWKVNFNMPKIYDPAPQEKAKGALDQFFVASKNSEGRYDERAIKLAQDEAESVWKRLMIGELTLEEFRTERQGKIKPVQKAEYHSGITNVIWKNSDRRWQVTFLAEPGNPEGKLHSTKSFTAESRSPEHVMAALEKAKEFASTVTLGKPNKRKPSKK